MHNFIKFDNHWFIYSKYSNDELAYYRQTDDPWSLANRTEDKWLNGDIDWGQSEWFPLRAGSQGRAFGFFQDQPSELLNALGIVVIEGEHPGSSYYAAELRESIQHANESVERLGLPFRFKQRGVQE